MLYLKLLGALFIRTEGTDACIKSECVHSNGFSARRCFSLPFLFLLYGFLRPFATVHAGQNEPFLCGSSLSFSNQNPQSALRARGSSFGPHAPSTFQDKNHTAGGIYNTPSELPSGPLISERQNWRSKWRNFACTFV